MDARLERAIVITAASTALALHAAAALAQPAAAEVVSTEPIAEMPDAAGAAVAVPEPADEADAAPPEQAPFVIGGWVEAYYAYNFNQPSNGITDLRGFDNRHDSFNLSIVALDAQWDWEGVHGRITLQWGTTPATYYLAETAAPALGSGVGPQDASLWQWVQQAYAGYRVPIGSGLDVEAGLFLSPVGVETLAVKDGFLYSRTNLFYGLPFYHTGIRVSYALADELTLVAWVINGWNTVLDQNDEKSVVAQASFSAGELLSGSFSYVGGVERPRGAPEGRAWRHTLDLNATLRPIEWLAIQGQVTGGLEPNAFGTSAYAAGMLAVRVALTPWLAAAARGDFFWESLAASDAGTASAIFWPVEWVASATVGLDLHPEDHVSLRIEYRHDHAAGDAYFAGTVTGDGAASPFVRNARAQDTLTIGATSWF